MIGGGLFRALLAERARRRAAEARLERLLAEARAHQRQCQEIARMEIARSRGRQTQTYVRASAEGAAIAKLLRSDAS